jgi:hypothetical protein
MRPPIDGSDGGAPVMTDPRARGHGANELMRSESAPRSPCAAEDVHSCIATTGESLRRFAAMAILAACAGACEGAAPSSQPQGSTETSPPPPPLPPEAGFVDVPPQPTAAKYPARMFYAFRSADQDPAHKPLMVFFNGGPGWATSAGLLAYGTGPVTVDGASAIPNPASFTRFANLLYIDERMAGFSYGESLSSAPDCSMDVIEDASDFVRVLLAFFDAHPALVAAPVVLVGESYGGVRATHTLDLLLRYQTTAAAGGADLPGLIQAHYDKVFPEHAGTPIDEATAAKQFGAQVLIEPLVLGPPQVSLQQQMVPDDPYIGYLVPGNVDPYNASKPYGWSSALNLDALKVIADPAGAKALFGVPLDSIAALKPQARVRDKAFRYVDVYPHDISPEEAAGLDEANAALASWLGKLGPNDTYYALTGRQCSGEPEFWNDDTLGAVFVENLRHVRTFITHARWDMVIYAPAIPAALQEEGFSVQTDSAARPNVDRPGWFTVDLPATTDPDEPATKIEVRFPLYETSGHMVAASQPAELAADVEEWLSAH